MQKNIRKYVQTGALTLLLGASACNKASTSTSAVTQPIQPVSQVVLEDTLKQKGVYQGTQTSKIDSQYKVVSTTGDEKYYVMNDHLVSSSRKPKDKEKALIYWRAKFRGCAYRETPLTNESLGGHEQPMLELACDSQGVGVVYDPSHESVKRVFNYEAK